MNPTEKISPLMSAERRERRNAYSREWYGRNREQQRAYRIGRRDKDREWRQENKEHLRATAWTKQEKNKARRREYKRNYERRRKADDPVYKALCNLRGRLSDLIKAKQVSTMQLLGCSLRSFKIYIESQFEVGMCWENYGKGENRWHLDHIIPCALFDLTNPEHIRRCFHFSNVQPLWGVENMSKGARLTEIKST